MLNLAIIYHMHQPYYKNILTDEAAVPWVRLHAIKDYVDMVTLLAEFPKLRLTFNVVPSLMEQVEDYVRGNVNDRFFSLSRKPTAELTSEDKEFILNNFFHINPGNVISIFPRYHELYLKKKHNEIFSSQDLLDLVTWFNLAWYDPMFRENIPQLRQITAKARFFSEEDKLIVLDKQIDILKKVIPTYKQFSDSGQAELIVSPYYHPILPLLYNSRTAKEANAKAVLPKTTFSYPQDAKEQINSALNFYKERFNHHTPGMWPSEEAVCEHILPLFIEAGVPWIVTDEAMLFKSLRKKRDGKFLYQPYALEREEGRLSIVFRDRNLSDLIGFEYYKWKPQDAANDFIKHLKTIAEAFKGKDILVTIALDGENAWEYYRNDGYDFLRIFYQKISECEFVKPVTVGEYLKTNPPKTKIKRLAAGSWIYGDFNKWIGSTYKNKAWEYLKEARDMLESHKSETTGHKSELAWKQMYILEGSDWFWWYGDRQKDFDELFRMHLRNLYTILEQKIPEYLNSPIEP